MKITKEMVLDKILEIKDISVEVDDECICVTVEDFEGYDDNWQEIETDYDETEVDAFEEWLEEHCNHEHGDFYTYYEFEDFYVKWGYASMDE